MSDAVLIVPEATPNIVSSIISHLGGRTAFSVAAQKCGINAPFHTVGSWITRNSIPFNHLTTVQRVAAHLGLPLKWEKVFA